MDCSFGDVTSFSSDKKLRRGENSKFKPENLKFDRFSYLGQPFSFRFHQQSIVWIWLRHTLNYGGTLNAAQHCLQNSQICQKPIPKNLSHSTNLLLLLRLGLWSRRPRELMEIYPARCQRQPVLRCCKLSPVLTPIRLKKIYSSLLL
jgi:hypothetical protein